MSLCWGVAVLNVVMLGAAVLNVVMLGVVVPYTEQVCEIQTVKQAQFKAHIYNKPLTSVMH
jgi:hypothetical protein